MVDAPSEPGSEPAPSEDRPFPGRCCGDPVFVRMGFMGDGFDVVKDCEQPCYVYCGACWVEGFMRCGTSRASVCKGCASRYRGRVRDKAASGIEGLRKGAALFVTLTGPGESIHCRVHQYRGRGCPWGGYGDDCEWCPCTSEVSLDRAEFNRTLTARVNRFLEGIKRGEASPLVRHRRAKVPLTYFQAREVHRGGVLHVHLILCRSDGRPLMLNQRNMKQLAMAHGFGHSFKSKRIDSHWGASEYVSKYVSKSADSRAAVEWRDDEGRRVPGCFRTWTSARAYGISMSEIREKARERFRQSETEVPQAPSVSLDLYRDSYAKNLASWKIRNVEKALRLAFWPSGRPPSSLPVGLEVERWVPGAMFGLEVGRGRPTRFV